ncbi:hypothetical protein E2P81_ATG11161 [Venturia nashicola]|uniref:Uncharacterized protein n=1 Tax=Venturia nashicola TaxID=86259 RepID=A0A4Z1P0S2_9PEZI|nr:hypothetical protein E6O75_ATG10841 [Venturia nashicola]TLD35042.1 hypothetical protein E2P81_ATG11161 [Venturia nashicola]
MSLFCNRWLRALLSLGQLLRFVSAIEIVYPDEDAAYSEPPYEIAWTLTPVESRDLDKIDIYLTSFQLPHTALVQILWASVDANTTRTQIAPDPDEIPTGDYWKLSFHDSSSDFFDAPLALSAEFSIKDASLSAPLPSNLGSTPSASVDLSIPAPTSSIESHTKSKTRISEPATEPTPSPEQNCIALKTNTAIPHPSIPHDETAYPGLSVGAATGIGVGITCTLFGLCAALCHIKANRRRAAKAQAANPLDLEEDVYEYEVGKAVSVDISRHVSVMGVARDMGQGRGGKRVVQVQRCPTVRMGTGQKLSSEISR